MGEKTLLTVGSAERVVFDDADAKCGHRMVIAHSSATNEAQVTASRGSRSLLSTTRTQFSVGLPLFTSYVFPQNIDNVEMVS